MFVEFIRLRIWLHSIVQEIKITVCKIKRYKDQVKKMKPQ